MGNGGDSTVTGAGVVAGDRVSETDAASEPQLMMVL